MPAFLLEKFIIMKKLIISALAVIFCIAGASAQDLKKAKTPKSPDEKTERFTQKLTTELSLDAAQQERVKGISLDRFKQIEEIKVQAGLNAADRRQKMKNIEDGYATNMKGVLSEEQFTKFQTLRSEMKEKAFERRKGK